MTPLLEVDDVHTTYGEAVHALRGVSLALAEGEVVAVLGANGAGKTTVARTVTGLLRRHRGRIVRGAVTVGGDRIDHLPPVEIVRRGVGQVLEGRRIFTSLTVEENLRAAVFAARRLRIEPRHDDLLELFPELGRRRGVLGGNLSGGEQQILAIARALVQSPRLLVLDEPTLGLAPRLVERIGAIVADINGGGTTVLLVDQSLAIAPDVAGRAYVLHRGSVAWTGEAAHLRTDPEVRSIYLGEAPDHGRPA